MRPDLDAIRARCKAAKNEQWAVPATATVLAADVPVLLDYIRELEDALESLSDGRLTPMDVGPAEWTPLERPPTRRCYHVGSFSKRDSAGFAFCQNCGAYVKPPGAK